jgi:quercetin dioxygenase-like cupin family protein
MYLVHAIVAALLVFAPVLIIFPTVRRLVGDRPSEGLMEVLERLQDLVPDDAADVRRIVLFGPQTGARDLSAVLVRVPSAHEFSLHTHPGSEDCFFVLSGWGEALEPNGRFPIAAPAGVWIPAGHPHGLRAGSGGMLEVGFQSPADHTAVPFEGVSAPASALVTSSLPPSLPPAGSPAMGVRLPGPHRLAPSRRRVRGSRILSECHDRSPGLRVRHRGRVG